MLKKCFSTLRFYLTTTLLVSVSSLAFAVSDTTSTIPLIAPAVPGKSIAFLAIGDWGRRGAHHQREDGVEMGKVAEELNASFTLAVGDNFYESGVKSLTDSHWKESFEDIYTAKSLQKRWYVALGNHDYNGNVQAQIDYTQHSTRWYMPARYYSSTIAVDDTTNLLLVVYDSNPFITGYHFVPGKMMNQVATEDTAAQLKWMDSVLSHSSARWKIVVAHHPIYSGGQHGNIKVLMEHVLPIIRKYHVQAYICGHDHDMQHLVSEGEVTNYFVTGAGSEVRDVNKTPITKFCYSTTGFMAATISANEMEMNFIDFKGKILYTTKVER